MTADSHSFARGSSAIILRSKYVGDLAEGDGTDRDVGE